MPSPPSTPPSPPHSPPESAAPPAAPTTNPRATLRQRGAGPPADDRPDPPRPHARDEGPPLLIAGLRLRGGAPKRERDDDAPDEPPTSLLRTIAHFVTLGAISRQPSPSPTSRSPTPQPARSDTPPAPPPVACGHCGAVCDSNARYLGATPLCPRCRAASPPPFQRPASPPALTTTCVSCLAPMPAPPTPQHPRICQSCHAASHHHHLRAGWQDPPALHAAPPFHAGFPPPAGHSLYPPPPGPSLYPPPPGLSPYPPQPGHSPYPPLAGLTTHPPTPSLGPYPPPPAFGQHLPPPAAGPRHLPPPQLPPGLPPYPQHRPPTPSPLADASPNAPAHSQRGADQPADAAPAPTPAAQPPRQQGQPPTQPEHPTARHAAGWVPHTTTSHAELADQLLNSFPRVPPTHSAETPAEAAPDHVETPAVPLATEPTLTTPISQATSANAETPAPERWAQLRANWPSTRDPPPPDDMLPHNPAHAAHKKLYVVPNPYTRPGATPIGSPIISPAPDTWSKYAGGHMNGRARTRMRGVPKGSNQDPNQHIRSLAYIYHIALNHPDDFRHLCPNCLTNHLPLECPDPARDHAPILAALQREFPTEPCPTCRQMHPPNMCPAGNAI